MPRGRPIDPRWAFAPLEATLRSIVRMRGESISGYLHAAGGPNLYRNWCRWRAYGYVPFDSADHFVHDILGLHMGEVWPDEYWRTDNIPDDQEVA